MSADDWVSCPICIYKRKNSFKLLKDKYGKISQEEYEDLKKELNEEHEDDEDVGGSTPVRIDREYGLSDKGYVYLSFSAVCQKCGASWQHNGEKILPLDKDDAAIVKEMMKQC